MSGVSIMMNPNSQITTSSTRITTKVELFWHPSMQILPIMRIEIITVMVSFVANTCSPISSSISLTYSLLQGNGRRLCPGIHLADRNLFHAISKILWAFNIEKATDPKTGKPVEPDTSMVTGYREGLTACAYEFPVKLTVRSPAKRKTILKEHDDAKANVFPDYEKTAIF